MSKIIEVEDAVEETPEAKKPKADMAKKRPKVVSRTMPAFVQGVNSITFSRMQNGLLLQVVNGDSVVSSHCFEQRGGEDKRLVGLHAIKEFLKVFKNVTTLDKGSMDELNQIIEKSTKHFEGGN